MASKRARVKKKTRGKTASTRAKRPARKVAARRVVAKRAPARAAGRKEVARSFPETLRLTRFTPSLTVGDLAKSLAFYTQALGFFAGEQWKGEDGSLQGVMLKAGAMEIGLSQDDWKLGRDRKKGLGFRVFCETTQDIDAIAARARAAGHALAEEPKDNPEWGVRSFSVDDPDGYHLTFTRKL